MNRFSLRSVLSFGCSLFIWVASLPQLQAQEAPPTGPDSATLHELVAAYEGAIRSGDIPKSGIRQKLAKDFSATLPGGELVQSYGDLSKAENALRTMVGRGTTYATPQITVDPLIHASGDVAAFTGQTSNSASAQGNINRQFKTYWTAIARKEGNIWRLVRHQAVLDTANNKWHVAEGGSGGGIKGLLIAAIVAGVLGLVIGFIMAKVLAAMSSKQSPAASQKASAPVSKSDRAWANPANDAAPTKTEPSPPVSTTSGSKRVWETEDTSSQEDKPAESSKRGWEKPSADDDADPPASSGKRAWDK